MVHAVLNPLLQILRSRLALCTFCAFLIAQVAAFAQSSIVLSWDAVSGSSIAGYRVYKGTASRSYSEVLAVGNVTQAAITGLTSGTTYFFSVTCNNNLGVESEFSSEVSFTTATASSGGGGGGADPPLSWQTQPIGNHTASGIVTTNGQTITISTAAVLAGTADTFQFFNLPMSGDGEIKARIISLDATNLHACAGVMIRENFAAGARYAFFGVDPKGIFHWQWRRTSAGVTAGSLKGKTVVPIFWVKIVRKGKAFFPFKSTDGSKWTALGSCVIGMSTNVYAGLAVSSGSTNSVATAWFDNVGIVP